MTYLKHIFSRDQILNDLKTNEASTWDGRHPLGDDNNNDDDIIEYRILKTRISNYVLILKPAPVTSPNC